MSTKRILVAPLNWGLGHATRCIPIINALLANNFEVEIASDGPALELLKKEFPKLKFHELPTYDVKYSKKGAFFQLKMLWESPKLLKSIYAEKKALERLLKETHFDGIISDNRMGIRDKKIPSVFITHQLNVLSGSTTTFSSKMHRRYIKKFDECWVPDVPGKPNLSGKMGHLKRSKLTIKYLGVLSRLEKTKTEKKYDVMALVSGPEPQRQLLEDTFRKELKRYDGEVLLVRGVIEDTQKHDKEGNITIYNYLSGKTMEDAVNQSELIVSRSGYTTIMDLTKLEKPAFFIPTPGQFEQKYLAKRLRKKGLVPSCKQHKFKIEKLETVAEFKGLGHLGEHWIDLNDLFALF